MHGSNRLSSICLGFLDSNLVALQNTPNALKNEDVVHDLRVATKRLRAAWKMVPDTASTDGLAARRKRALRKFSALLAGDRDLAVLNNLAGELQKKHPKAPFHLVMDALKKEAEDQISVDSTDRIHKILEKEKIAWRQVCFESPAAELSAIRKALRVSRAAARTITLEAMTNNDPELWHNWRKRVKQLRYQREFLAEIQQRIPGKWDARISRLGSLLGERNDLANLIVMVEKLGLDEKSSRIPLRKAIAMEERRILGNCRRLGRQNLIPRTLA